MKKIESLEVRMYQQPKINEKLEKILARLDELELGKGNGNSGDHGDSTGE